MKILKLFYTAIFVFIFHAGFSQTEKNTPQLTVILGAFPEEIKLLEDSLANKKTLTISGLKFITGRLKKRDVAVAYTGMGKVNASMTTTLAIEHFHPSEVIFTGIAGALNPDLNPGDIVIGEKSVQHDLIYIYPDTVIPFQPDNLATNLPNPVFFPSDSSLISEAQQVSSQLTFKKIELADTGYFPKIITGTIATGDAFIASSVKKTEIISRLHADAVEMEGAAVAQICYQKKIQSIIPARPLQ